MGNLGEPIELYKRISRNRETGQVTEFAIIARKTGGRYWYSSAIANQDKLIFIRLSTNGSSIEYPYTTDEPIKLWEEMLNVWVLRDKKRYYIDKLVTFALKVKQKFADEEKEKQ